MMPLLVSTMPASYLPPPEMLRPLSASGETRAVVLREKRYPPLRIAIAV